MKGLSLRNPAFLAVISGSGFDPDAQAYINAVEAVDGQALEAGVRTAINAFVVGCKSDGIWNPIKASCILAGARTRLGAMVPLVGAAPTSFNFVDGDYDRKTGLIGDGSTKYLLLNRNNVDDPQDNQHVSCYASVVGGAAAISLFSGSNLPGASHVGLIAVRSRNNAAIGLAMQVGFNGISRSVSGFYAQRVNDTSVVHSQSSQPPANGTFALLRNETSHGTHRISFYSIGEDLDLGLLRTRLDTLMIALAVAIP